MFRDFPRSIVSRIKKQNNSPKDCSSLTLFQKLRKGMFFLSKKHSWLLYVERTRLKIIFYFSKKFFEVKILLLLILSDLFSFT